MRTFGLGIIAWSISLLLSCSGEQPSIGYPNGSSPLICSEGKCGTNCTGNNCPTKAIERVHLEIDPTAAGYGSQQLLDVSIIEDLPKGMELKPRFFFYGMLSSAESLLSTTVTSGVKAPAQTDILGMVSDIIAIPQVDKHAVKNSAAVMMSRQNNLLASVDPKNGDFTLTLLANQKYQIVINPLGKNGLPPTFFPALISTDHSATINLSTRGSVISGEVSFSNLSANSLAEKASVKIVQGQRLVSSVGKVTKGGLFSVQLSDPLYEKLSDNPLFLIIAPDQEFSYLPVIREKLELDVEDIIGKKVVLKPIRLENLEIPGDASLFVYDGQGQPAKEARIYLRSKFANHFVDQQLQVNAEGLAKGKLMAGMYKLAVVPPEDSIYGIYFDNSLKIEEGASITISLQPRSIMDGVVLDFNHDPVEGALIHLTRFAKEDSNRLESVLREASLRIDARSDKQGRWCIQPAGAQNNDCQPVRLDEGRYRLLIIPPPGSKLPYYTSTFEFPQTNSLSVVLQKPFLVSGKILGPSALAPVSKAFIKIFSTSVELESGEPFLLGQSITDSEGNFSAFISPE